MKQRRSSRVVLIAVVGAVFGTAHGQVGPQGAQHATVGPGTGLGAPMSPTGGFPTAIPLDLPAGRGRLPVPLSVVYDGTLRSGAAGAGWDVPLWSVRRSHSAWRRKPEATSNGSDGSEQAAERIYVSLGGGSQLMVPHGAVYVPFVGDEYSELRVDGDGWRLRTLDNVEYRFTP